MHRRLERGFDADAHRRLVLGNWVRTVAWTARGVILLLILARVVSAAGPQVALKGSAYHM
jgi:hypothetical protein